MKLVRASEGVLDGGFASVLICDVGLCLCRGIVEGSECSVDEVVDVSVDVESGSEIVGEVSCSRLSSSSGSYPALRSSISRLQRQNIVIRCQGEIYRLSLAQSML